MLTERLEFGRLLELAGRRALGEFRVSADRFPRLQKILADGQAGELDLRVAFEPLGESMPQMSLEVRGQLGLVCQRCLSALVWPVRVDAKLTLVSDERDAEQLADPFDSVIVPAEGLDLTQVFEDEILAAIPLAVLHAGDEECEAAAAPEQPGDRRARPFASLRELMRADTGGDKPN